MTVGVVFAGGAGSRLYPWTPARAKFTVPHFDKSVIAKAFDFLDTLGIERCVVLVADSFRDDAVAAIGRATMPVSVVRAPSHSWSEVWSEVANQADGMRAVIVNCDLVLDSGWANIIDTHIASSNALTIAATRLPSAPTALGKPRWRALDSDGSIVESFPATLLHEIGLSVVEPNVWDLLPNMLFNTDDPFSDELIELASINLKVGYHLATEPWFDCGTWPGLLEAHLRTRTAGEGWVQTEDGSWIHKTAHIEAAVSVTHSVIGPRAVVSGHGTVSRAIAFPDSKIVAPTVTTVAFPASEPFGYDPV